MPQNLIDTPAEWQEVIVVPAPGDQAAMANDATKPHSLFHALAALARRTRWLRGLLETHNHDNRYAPLAHNHDDRYALLGHNHDNRYAQLGHHHDDRYYTKAAIDARREQWATLLLGSAGTYTPYISLTADIPAAGYYLLEGHATWSSTTEGADWRRRFWVNTTLVFDRTTTASGYMMHWIDKVVVYISSVGSYTFQYAPHGLSIRYGDMYGYPTWLGDILLRVSRI